MVNSFDKNSTTFIYFDFCYNPRMTKNRTKMAMTLFKYLYFEILLYCFVAFLFFFVIFFVNNLLVNIQDNLIRNVSFSLIMEFFLYSIPIVIANAVPYAAFIGSLMCLGRFVSDYEFLALNSLGVSKVKILKPVLIAALTISLINFAINDFLIPYTAPRLNSIYFEMMSENPAMQIQSYSIKKTGKIVIANGEVSKNGINDILIIDESGKGLINFLSAKHSRLLKQKNPEIIMSIEPSEPRLLMLSTEHPKDFDYAYGEKLRYNFLLSDMDNFNFFSLGPGQLNSLDLAKKIKQIKENKEQSSSYLNWYNLEFHKKFSIPLGSVFFIFLAYALSRSLRIYNQGVGFVIGLFISVGYWAILMLGQSLSVNQNFNSTFAAWFPNVLLLGIALFLMVKKVRS